MAPSHVDLSVLWVPIMPETSKLGEQMEQVGKDATESFGKGSTGLGDKIHESVTKSKDKIKDVFQRTGSDAGKTMSDAFKEETKAVEDTAEDVGKKAGKRIQDAVKDALPEAFNASGGQIDAIADKLGKNAGEVLGKGIGSGLDKINEYTQKIGVDISGWTGAIKDVAEPFAGLKDDAKGIEGSIKEWSSNFEAMPGKIGNIASSLTGVAGEIGLAVAALNAAEPTITKLDNAINNSGKLGEILEKFDPAGMGKSFGDMFGADKTRKWLGDHLGYNPDMFVSPDTPLGRDNPKSWADLDADGRGLGGLTSAPDSLFGGGPGMASVPDSLTSPGKGWGNLVPDDAINWDAVHAGEAGSWDANTGNGYFGGLQFDQNTWNDFGGTDFAPRPDLATPDQQKAVADRVPVGQRAKRWPNTYKLGVGGGGGSAASSFASSGGMSASSGQLPATPPDENSVRSWVEQNFGIPNTFGTGSWENAAHDYDGKLHHPGGAKEGPAFDFHGTTAQMDALANWVADNYKDKTLELIHQGPGFDHNREIKNAKFGDVYGADLNAAHADHVHWAMTEAPNGSAGGNRGPLGSQNDPLFVSAAEKGSGAAGGDSDSSSLAQQLGAGFLGGIAQSVGLDGSVFKTFSGASNPMDFGITKIGTGLLNWASGMMPSISGHSPKQQQQGHTYNVDQSFNLTQHGVEGQGETPYKAAMNSSNRTSALAANMPG